MIKRPQMDLAISFESGNGDVTQQHKLSAVTIYHIYSEASETAKKLVGDPPNTMTIYDLFRSKLAEYLTIGKDDLHEGTIVLIVEEMQNKINDLKKTCSITAESQS